MSTLGTIVFLQDKIILEYNDGYSQKFKSTTTPKYEEGTEWIVYNEVKYFLVEDE